MKRILLILLIGFAGCVALPAAEWIDTDGLQEIMQPHFERLGSPDVINTHICDNCGGKIIFAWVDANNQPLYFVLLEKINNKWIILDQRVPEDA